MPHSPLPGDPWRPVASEARAACRSGLHKIKTLHKFDKILIKLIFSLFLFPSFNITKLNRLFDPHCSLVLLLCTKHEFDQRKFGEKSTGPDFLAFHFPHVI